MQSTESTERAERTDMSTAPQLTDREGTPVVLERAPEENTYRIFYVGDDRLLGHADYLDRPANAASGRGAERVFHHTVVDDEFAGRGLAGVLVSAALADARGQGLPVVPVCSYVAQWIRKNDWDGAVAPVTDDVQEWLADQG
jgi:predicted GNAT family acetyltransferase